MGEINDLSMCSKENSIPYVPDTVDGNHISRERLLRDWISIRFFYQKQIIVNNSDLRELGVLVWY